MKLKMKDEGADQNTNRENRGEIRAEKGTHEGEIKEGI